MLVRAGMATASEVEGSRSVDTAGAIMADPALTDEQRATLLAVYHSYVHD